MHIEFIFILLQSDDLLCLAGLFYDLTIATRDNNGGIVASSLLTFYTDLRCIFTFPLHY